MSYTDNLLMTLPEVVLSLGAIALMLVAAWGGQRSTRAVSWTALLCTTGIILGAAYSLYLYRRVAYGEVKSDAVRAMPDLSRRALWLLAPIAGVVLWMGVYPESFMAPMRADVGRLVARIERATPQSDSRPTAGRPVAAGAAHAAVPAAAHGGAH